MRLEDLGYDRSGGYHDKNLTRMESKFVGVLWTDCIGHSNRISADELAVRFEWALSGYEVEDEIAPSLVIQNKTYKAPHFDQVKRDVRRIHNHLLTRHDNIPILSKAGTSGGYWIAATEAEAVSFYDTFRKRGMTGLVKASRGRKAALVDMMQQLSFEFEELADKTFTGQLQQRAGDSTPIEVVDAFLEKMTADPEKFADGLRKIGKKYGSVLLPKDQVRKLTTKTRELQELVGQMGL